MRQDEKALREAGLAVFVVGPDRAKAFASFAQRFGLPEMAIPDPDHAILERYGQDVRLLRFGRLPAAVMVGTSGKITWVHYGASMADTASKKEILAHL